jgi:CO/xanthine dehydrogenase FAD-binding subunit
VKPLPFEYHQPADEDEVVRLLHEYGEEGRVLAGGQSLVPLMNFRLAQPGQVIDIMRVPTLSFVRVRDGRLLIGAATRQWTVERSPLVARRWALLHRALAHVGHPQIRTRGTFGGSVAHADPAAEIPVALAALGAWLHLRSVRGTRIVSWRKFFRSEFVTACAPDEMLTCVEVAPQLGHTGVSFREYAARSGDFAVAGAAASVSLDGEGRCTHAALALLACGPTPVRAEAAERLLVGHQPTTALAADAGEAAASALQADDLTSLPITYRRTVVRGLVRQAVLEASHSAAESRGDPDGQ